MSTIKKTAAQLFAEDIEKSGLSTADAKKLRFKLLSPDEADEWQGGKNPVRCYAYEIPYFNSRGKQTGYSRLKILKRFKPKFGKSTQDKKDPKYLQRNATNPHLYIPTNFYWPRNEDDKIIVDRLVVTEGEKKAAKACAVGIACVALGGVSSFQAKKKDMLILPELEDFDLTNTKIEVCYDSDVLYKEPVRYALQTFALQARQLAPKSITTVPLNDENEINKVGLDDFLVKFKSNDLALKAFEKLPRENEIRSSQLDLLDQEVCYLKSAGRLYNIKEDRFYEGSSAAILDLGPKYKTVHEGKEIATIDLWIKYRGPNSWCEKTVFEPGKPKRYRDTRYEKDVINLWSPSKVKPIKGTCDLWLDLVRYVMGTGENYDWFMKWLAFPLQTNQRTLQAVFVHSNQQGVGKNFVIEPLIQDIYGDSYSLIKATDLEGSFNSWARCKRFVFAEEIYMSVKKDRDATMGSLKSFVTNPIISVNEKYRPREVLANFAQLYMTANQSNALSLDRADRRIFVVHAPEKKKDDAYYKELDTWCKRPDAAGIALHHLLHEVDVSSFNPKTEAPRTEDKEEIIEHSRGMVESYVAALEDDPCRFIAADERHLFTASEIYNAINSYARQNNMPPFGGSPDSIGRFLQGTKIPRKRVNVRRLDNKRTHTSLYAIHDRRYWRRASEQEWIRHYEKFTVDSDENQKRIKDEERRNRKAEFEVIEGGRK